MPKKKEKIKSQLNRNQEDRIGPSPTLMRRIFGGPISKSTAKEWPELEATFAGREIEMPSEAAKVNRIIEMGPLTRWMNPDAYAITGPFGTVALNREMIEKEKQDLPDVLVHELAHIGQGKKGFLRKFLNPSDVESEAINREVFRKVRRSDIELKAR